MNAFLSRELRPVERYIVIDEPYSLDPVAIAPLGESHLPHMQELLLAIRVAGTAVDLHHDPFAAQCRKPERAAVGEAQLGIGKKAWLEQLAVVFSRLERPDEISE